MQCPECLGYRHDGPCPDLHDKYMEAFTALMEYLDKHEIPHRSQAVNDTIARLESICSHAKYKYEMAEMGKWKS